MPPVAGATPRYRAARAEVLRIEPLGDGLTAVFHRASGITHLLAEPAPEILAALADEWLTQARLLERLSETFDLAGDTGVLSGRLDELVAAGLVEGRAA
ncbi:HPr-rel-A system PqqD family peptide chaperone [uncultured Sphingomonas sp.]|uniref:HPr-rel-A system PqqD family peptide chaperone n=1 Tax=uncultured Sphingomonas sp. TaxID=158754 RepID=UPI0035CB3309